LTGLVAFAIFFLKCDDAYLLTLTTGGLNVPPSARTPGRRQLAPEAVPETVAAVRGSKLGRSANYFFFRDLALSIGSLFHKKNYTYGHLYFFFSTCKLFPRKFR
jgi:hypothetical protein